MNVDVHCTQTQPLQRTCVIPIDGKGWYCRRLMLFKHLFGTATVADWRSAVAQMLHRVLYRRARVLSRQCPMTFITSDSVLLPVASEKSQHSFAP